MLWKSEGKTILDLAAERPDEFFTFFTNGTLITDEVVRSMAKIGNISPAIFDGGVVPRTKKWIRRLVSSIGWRDRGPFQFCARSPAAV